MPETITDQVEVTAGATSQVMVDLDARNGGVVRLFHPNGGRPHVELVGNEVTPNNTGGGLVTVTDGAGDPTIRLDGHALTIEGPIHQTSGGLAIMTGANGGVLQLFHPSGGGAHVELVANNANPSSGGGGRVTLTNADGTATIELDGARGDVLTTNVGMGTSTTGGGAVELIGPAHVPILDLVDNAAGGGSISVLASDGQQSALISQGTANAGRIDLISPSTGPIAVLGPHVAGGGGLFLFGPAGTETVRVSGTTTDPNQGFVGVSDRTGARTARLTFDTVGNSVVQADVKNFSTPHPTLPNTDIVYACIEGPEAAVYCRGTTPLVNGEARISLPDHFVHVANLSTLTAQLTPLSADSLGVAVEEKGPTGLLLKELQHGVGNYAVDWEVKCVRNGHENYQVTRPSQHMTGLGAAEPFSPSRVQLTAIAAAG